MLLSSLRFLAAVLCVSLASFAHAQEKGAYLGGMFGSFDYEEQGDGIGVLDDTTTAYQLFGGYRFNDFVAVELGLGGTGDIENSFPAFIAGLGDVVIDVEASYDIYTLEAIGMLPFDVLSVFAGVGYFSASLGGPVDIRDFGTIGALDGNESGMTATLGIQRDFRLDLERFSIRAEYQWLDVEEADASSFNVGFVYRF